MASRTSVPPPPDGLAPKRSPRDSWDDPDILQKLQSALSNDPSTEITEEVRTRHRTAILSALETRGDPFGRDDVLVLKAQSMNLVVRIPCSRLPVVVGRTKDRADIEVAVAGVSARHFRVEREGPFVRLTDLQSKNGTYVNDTAVQSTHLRCGDRLTVGTTDFVVERA